MAAPMAGPMASSPANEPPELPTTLPATELKRYLKAAGVASGALKQADGIVALVELARQKRVSLVPLKRQSTSEAVLRARDREAAAMGDEERLQYEQAFDAAVEKAVAAGASQADDTLDATHARRFLGRCRLPPGRLARVWEAINPDDTPSISRAAFAQACSKPIGCHLRERHPCHPLPTASPCPPTSARHLLAGDALDPARDDGRDHPPPLLRCPTACRAQRHPLAPQFRRSCIAARDTVVARRFACLQGPGLRSDLRLGLHHPGWE